MKLLVDAGNSRIKWWVPECQAQGVVERLALESLASEIAAVIDISRLSSVRVSCVAGKPIEAQLRSELGFAHNLEVKFARVSSPLPILTVAYRETQRLGVDRWLAMLAVRETFPDRFCAILDAGSAVTVDFIAADGVHAGGMIVPGVQTMARALWSNTSDVAVERLELVPRWRPGVDTYDCVRQGVSALYAGLVNEVHTYIDRSTEMRLPPAIVVTGGDRDWFEQAFSEPVVVDPHLVLKGLLVLDDLEK
ncbi:type III pantothenate kinase [Teredinibacter turnerae]|uniref:type III pantothenate kinase n=1 Tax=Teredinibacter turnerae TaxID=2426 RepID=UPI00036A9FBB|nr:type III pantothenate kinase [Teredinibacter turnerae]